MLSIKLDKKYALVKQVESSKSELVKLRLRGDKLIAITQDNNAMLAPQEREINVSDILTLFLSKDLPYGKAYGVTVEPMLLTEKLNKWGNIHFYRHVTDSEKQLIRNAFLSTHEKFIVSHKLQFLLPITIEVRQHSGKMQGSWHVAKDDTTGTMRLCPSSFVDLKVSGLRQIITHELGHPLWSTYLSDKLKARWVRLYHSALELSEFSIEDIRTLRKDIVKARISSHDFKKDLDEDSKPLFNACIEWVTKKHYIKPQFLDMLITDGDDLKAFWPNTVLHVAELQEIVTSYAKKNPCEFWCESLSLHGTKHELPEKVNTLVELTLRKVKTNT